MVENTKQTTVVHFIADGEVREFHFNFQIFEAGDIDVYLDETLTDTGYNVSIDEEIGGKVIFNQPPVNGTRITIIRNLDIKRTSDFQEGGAFRAKVINHELDYQVATLQQLDEKIGRSMIYPPYVQDGVSMQLPLPSAGKALVWNQQATALTNSSINVDNTIAEVTALQQQTAKSAEQVAEHWQQVSQQSAETAINSQKAQEAAEKALKYADLSSFGNIGDIQYTTRTDVPNGGAWCDAAEYTKEFFPDLYQMLVDGKLQKTDYGTFNSSVSSKGYCEQFALDTEVQKFKVPSLPDKYAIDASGKVVSLKPYVLLYAVAAEASVAQTQEFMSVLGGKANAGLDNITAEAKNLIVNLNDINLSAGVNKGWGSQWTAADDGLIFIYANAYAQTIQVKINNVVVYEAYTNNYVNGNCAWARIEKGQNVTYSGAPYSQSGGSNRVIFYPFKEN